MAILQNWLNCWICVMWWSTSRVKLPVYRDEQSPTWQIGVRLSMVSTPTIESVHENAHNSSDNNRYR